MKKLIIGLIVIAIIIVIGGVILLKSNIIFRSNEYTGKDAKLAEYTPKEEGYYTLEQNDKHGLIYYKIVDDQENIIAEKTSPNNDIIYLTPEYKLYYRDAKVEEGLTYNWDSTITSGVFEVGATIDAGIYSLTSMSTDDVCSYTISSSPTEYISEIIDRNNISGTGEIEVKEGQFLRYLDCQVEKK